MVVRMDTDIRQAMVSLKRAMAEAEDGKKLKRELSKRLRHLLNPLVAEQRARVLALPSRGGHGASMRSAIARQTRGATRWGGRNAGISVVQRARGMPRDFRYAGRMFNRAEGWSPMTLGGEVEHQQMSPSGWFDETTIAIRPEARRQIHEALEETAAKIAASAHRR